MATTKPGVNDSNTKRKNTSTKAAMKAKNSPKKSTTKSSKSTSSPEMPKKACDKKAKKVVSKNISLKNKKTPTKKKPSNAKSNEKKNASPKKTKPKIDYKTRHHIGRRKATENVISYSQSGTTFFDLYTDYKTFDLSTMDFSRPATKRNHDGSCNAKLPSKKLKRDTGSTNIGRMSSPSKEKENVTVSKEKKISEKSKSSSDGTAVKGLKIQTPKKKNATPCEKTEKGKTLKKNKDKSVEDITKTKNKSPKKKVPPVTSKCQDARPRGPWIRRQASLNASAVMTVLYEPKRTHSVTKDGDSGKSPESSRKVSATKSLVSKKVSQSSSMSKHKNVEAEKEKRGSRNKVTRTDKKTGQVNKVVAKSKGTRRTKKGPYRFRELKNLLDCDNNDLDCDVLKSIQKGFFSKGIKRKINSSDIQLGVFAHKKREASLNAQAMLAASSGRVGGRRRWRDYSSSETSSDSEFSEESEETSSAQSSVSSYESEIEVEDEIIDVVDEDDDEKDMRAARVLPDSFKITRNVTTVHHEIMAHWVDGLGKKESLTCKDSIQWTKHEMSQIQSHVVPLSSGNGIIEPVSQVSSPRTDVVKVTPRPSLQTPPLQSSPIQSSPLLMNGVVAPGSSPLPNGIVGPGNSPRPTAYSYNNSAIIPSSHCQSFTLNGLGSISLMATYPQRYESAFRVPSFNTSYYQHPGCYNQNGQVMQPVQDRYTHIVHHPIPVQPQQDLEIIFHHHNSHQTIKPCCSKMETVTCTVTHTQQHVNQKQHLPCQIQECLPTPPTSHQSLPPPPPSQPPAPPQLAPPQLTPQQLAPQQLAPQQLAPQQLAPQQFPPQQPSPQQFSSPQTAQQCYPQQWSSQQSVPQHFSQQQAPQQYPQQTAPHQFQHLDNISQQPLPQSMPQQYHHQSSAQQHFTHQQSTRQYSHQTSSTQQFQHQRSAPQQFQVPPHSSQPPYPAQQLNHIQNSTAPSKLQALPPSSCPVPSNRSLPSNPPKYHTLTAPPPKTTPGPRPVNQMVQAPLPKTNSGPPTRHLAPQSSNLSAAPPRLSVSQQVNLHSPSSGNNSGHNATITTNLAPLPKSVPTTPKQTKLHPIPKPYTHPMPQIVSRPLDHSVRELRKRPRSVTGVSSEGGAETVGKKIRLNSCWPETPLKVVDGDKKDVEGACQRRKERTETVVRETKKRSEKEGCVVKSDADQGKEGQGGVPTEKRKPERLSPRLLQSKEKAWAEFGKSNDEQTKTAAAVLTKEKSVTEKVNLKSKDGAQKVKVKGKTLNNNSKSVVNNNKKMATGEKAKLHNSKKATSVRTKLLSDKKKVGQKLLGDKKSLKAASQRSKLLLDKRPAKQKAKLLNKKGAVAQKPKLLKSAGQRPKLLKLKKSVTKGAKLLNCKKSPGVKLKGTSKKSPSDKSRLFTDKKSSMEKKRVDMKSKGSGQKVEQGGSVAARRRSTRKKLVDNSWQWVGEPEMKLVYTCNDLPGVERPCYSAICHNDGDIIRVRDCVLLRSGPRKKDLPFIAKIAAFFEKDGDKMMSILWYYRPEHTEAGRLPNHLPAELFASKHKDENNIACIEDKCLVLTVAKYSRYRAKLKLLEENLPLSYSKQIIVPKGEDESSESLPTDVDPETVFLCRQVYDFRQKRILKNPS